MDVILGIMLLVAGGYAVVHGSVQAARMLGWSEFFIGVVLVGFGTSAPELFASVGAAWHGSAGLAFGNVVGSNISNLLLILAVTAIVQPLSISEETAQKDGPMLLALTAVFVAVSLLFPLWRIVALGYLAIIAWYIWSSHQSGKQTEDEATTATATYNKQALLFNIGIAIAGVTMLVFGADMLVAAATELARSWGVSETIIGLTIVAVGTSLPELVSSGMSAYKGKTNLAIGNIVGSNIYNLFGILGVTGIISPSAVPGDIRWVYNPIMLIATAVVVYLMYKKRTLSRQTGGYLFGGYTAYATLLYFAS